MGTRSANFLLILFACGRGGADGQHDAGPASRRGELSSVAADSAVVTPGEIALGDSVFNGGGRDSAGVCATCHGPNGVGTGAAPSLRDTVWLNGDGSLGFIEGTIYQGVPHPSHYPLPMPPLGRSLTERQLHGVAAYVYSLSRPAPHR